MCNVCKLLSSQLVLELPIGHPVPSPLQNVFRRPLEQGTTHGHLPRFAVSLPSPVSPPEQIRSGLPSVINAAFTPCCRCFPAQQREPHPNQTAGSCDLAELITSPRRSGRTAPHQQKSPPGHHAQLCASNGGAQGTHLAPAWHQGLEGRTGPTAQQDDRRHERAA